MWQLAYFQMAGSGKQRNQDALFNGQEVCYALLRKTRVLNFSDELTVRLAISDGVFSTPAPHLASRFWMQTFMQYGDESGRFLRQYHGKFCDEMIESHLPLYRQSPCQMAVAIFVTWVTAEHTVSL